MRFDGQFGTSHSDSRHLWKALRKRAGQTRRRVRNTVDNATLAAEGSAPSGSLAVLESLDAPDGSRIYFNFPATFWAGAEVYLNGLLQTENHSYRWVTGSQLVFTFAPIEDDEILVRGSVSE